MADRDVQVPAEENLQAAQAAAIVYSRHHPTSTKPRKACCNPNYQNAVGEEVTLEVCSVFNFLIYRICVFAYRYPLVRFQVHVMLCFRTCSLVALQAV